MLNDRNNTKWMIGGCGVLFVALLCIGNNTAWNLFFMVYALCAVTGGIICGVMVMVYLLNTINERSNNNVNFPVYDEPKLMSLIKKFKFYHKWAISYLKFKLKHSKLVEALMKPKRATLKSHDVYEMIHGFGTTVLHGHQIKSAYDGNKYSHEVGMCKELTQLFNQLFDYSYRDFVEIWYAQVSFDRGNFHKMLCNDYWKLISNLSKKLQQVDFLNLIMSKYTRIISDYFMELRRTAQMPGSRDKNPLQFHLHPALRSSTTEMDYMRLISDYILTLTLPKEALQVTSVRHILREIFSGLVLMKTVDMLSDPDYINQTILSYLERRNEIEEDVGRAYSYAATYEDFIKIINKCNDLQILSQIRLRICTEIIQASTISSLKKDRSKEGKAKSMDKGELLMNRNLKRYINQCQVAKQQCEKKIRELGGEDHGSTQNNSEQQQLVVTKENQLLSFEEIMASPVARSYFLKYLRKINKSQLLKFWDQIEFVKTNKLQGKDLAKIVSHSYQTYISNASADHINSIIIDKSTLAGMKACLIGNKEPTDFFIVQKQIYDKLQTDHYPSFMVSEVYTEDLMSQMLDIPRNENYSTGNGDEDDGDSNLPTAFSDEARSSDALQQIAAIDEKLEYKAQALASLRPTSKSEPRMMNRLVKEIHSLQKEKWRLQLRVERSNMWWDNLDSWNIQISTSYFNSSQASSGGTGNFHYCVTVRLCDVVPQDSDNVTGWSVERSLKDFHHLHDSLKQCSEWVKKWKLPTVPLFRLLGNNKFLAESRQDLDIFLLRVMKDKTLRCSQTIFAFLSPDEEGMTSSASSSTIKPVMNISDFFKWFPTDAIEKMITSSTSSTTDELIESDESDDDDASVDSVASQAYILISEVFELTGLFRFLRHTLIVFVRVAFGRSIDRQLRETCQWLTSQQMICFYLKSFLDSLWPDGKLRTDIIRDRTNEEKEETKELLKKKLLENIPEVANTTIGHENARRGFLKVFYALQDKQLNKHLLFNLLGETIETVFPDIIQVEQTESSE